MSKKRFDPAELRKRLLGDVGFEWQSQRSFEKTRNCGGLASSAHADLGMAIQCILVGFDAPATRLLEKAGSWVKEAIAAEERPQRYFPDGTEASRYHTLAMCDWLLTGEHDAESFRRFVEYEDRYLTNSSAGKDKVEVSLTLPSYVNARAYDRALAVYSRTPGLSPPRSLRSLRSEAQMSYVICQHRLGRDFSDEEVADAAKRFLTRNMDNWLGGGHAVRAAEWIKLVYDTEENDLPPQQLLMKCYDHLPGCERIA